MSRETIIGILCVVVAVLFTTWIMEGFRLHYEKIQSKTVKTYADHYFEEFYKMMRGEC